MREITLQKLYRDAASRVEGHFDPTEIRARGSSPLSHGSAHLFPHLRVWEGAEAGTRSAAGARVSVHRPGVHTRACERGSGSLQNKHSWVVSGTLG